MTTGGAIMNQQVMPQNPKLAFAYVPYQEFKNLFSTNEALWKGTIFKELDIPFSKYRDNPVMNPFKKI